jgi:hypothetical protein
LPEVDNYTVRAVNGTLVVEKVPLTVTIVGDYSIYFGDLLPEFILDYNGFVNGDTPNTVFSGDPTFSFSPEYTAPGVYDLTITSWPQVEPANYDVTIVDGSLTVLETVENLSKLKSFLECVSDNTDPATSDEYPFIAYYSYENRNDRALYIPVGPSNNISGPGNYLGDPATLFEVGIGGFTILFNGEKIVWSAIIGNGNNQSSSTSEASSTSNKCDSRDVISTRMTPNNFDVSADLVVDNPGLSITVYPNPVKDILMISATGTDISDEDIMLFDVQGRAFAARSVRNDRINGFEIDMSGMQPGVYMIKLNTEEETKIIRVVKR